MLNRRVQMTSPNQIDKEGLKKLKRRAYTSFLKVDDLRSNLADDAGIAIYNENDFEKTFTVDDRNEENEGVIKVLEARYDAAQALCAAQSQKSRLVKLKNKNGSLSARQESALQVAKERVKNTSSELSELPPAGETFADWEEIKDTFRAVGHPPKSQEQFLVEYKMAMNDTLSELNQLEDLMDLPRSTIKSLEAEQEEFMLGGGRKKLKGDVAEVESLKTEIRRIRLLRKNDENAPASKFQPSGTGRKPKSKEERLADYDSKIKSLQDNVDRIISEMDGVDLIQCHKKDVERSRRYSKENNNNAEYERYSEIYKALKSLEAKAADEQSNGNMSERELSEFCKRALNDILDGANVYVMPKKISTAKATQAKPAKVAKEEEVKGNESFDDLDLESALENALREI